MVCAQLWRVTKSVTPLVKLVRPSEKCACLTQLFTAWATWKNEFVSFWADVQLWVKNLICWLKQSMQQNPSWKANSFSAISKFLHTVCELKVRSRIHNSFTMVHLPSQLNPANNFLFYSLQVLLNMPSHGRLSLPKGLILSGFLTKIENTSCCSPVAPHAHLSPPSFIQSP